MKSNDGRTRNQIDHVVTDDRHTSNVLDVKSMRDADEDSKHFLVRSSVIIRISSRNSKEVWKTSNMEFIHF